MERLAPIPSPPGHHVREFCHRFLPIAIFLGAIGLTAALWNQRFHGTTLFGEVEARRADVLTPEAGTLVEVRVDRFDTVTNGEILAVLRVLDPDRARRELLVLRTELETMRARMALDQTRNEQNVESLRAQWLEARVDLATAHVNLENARRELARTQRLSADRIVSEADVDLAQSVHDALAAEVEQRTTAVEGLANAVERLARLNLEERGGAMDVIADSLSAQEALITSEGNINLRSPMDGVVRTINHRIPGERVPANAVIATISAHRSDRIIGYVRQPLSLEPHPGMAVDIRTRGPEPQSARSQVMMVGSDFELVASPFRLRGVDNAVERGLPFWVELPPDLKVHPGELVDLIVYDSVP